MITGHKTAIYRNKPSAPLKHLLSKNLIKYGSILDYGCGHGADVNHLLSLGFMTDGFDPHWNPSLSLNNKWQTILCTFVLNVVTEEEEIKLLYILKGLVCDDGDIFITVRRDLPKEGAAGRGCYQRYVECPSGYKTIYSCSSFATFTIDKS